MRERLRDCFVITRLKDRQKHRDLQRDGLARKKQHTANRAMCTDRDKSLNVEVKRKQVRAKVATEGRESLESLESLD